MPKPNVSKQKTCATMVIEEEFPDGMTREEYRLLLRKHHVRFLARLILHHFPEIIEEAKANSIELQKAA